MVNLYNLYSNRIYYLHPDKYMVHMMNKYCNVVVSFTENCDLNYLHLECLYLGIPLIHNSKMLKEYGYYYEGYDTKMASKHIENLYKNGFNKEEYIHFLEFLEKTLTDKGFFSAPEKKSIMLNNIRSMFQRQNLTQKDIKILFGIFKQILNK